MKKALFFLLLITILLLSSCESTRGMSDFYEEWLTPAQVTEDCLLKDGEEPKVYYSTDLDSDIYYLRSNYYWVLGYSGYNGPGDSDLSSQVKELCLEKRAPIGLYTYEYTDTRSGVTGYGKYISSYSIKRYDYSIYLFVPMPDNLMAYFARIGLSYSDMNSSERLAQHRNTGASVLTVFEESPAYYANLSRGDVIIAVNGQDVVNSKSLDSIFDSCSSSEDVVITFLRSGIEHTTTLRPLY